MSARFDGALLRARRKKLGLTVEDLSGLAGLPYATVMNFETGTWRASVASLEKLCRALSCSPDALYSGEDDGEPDPRPTDLGPDADRWVAEALASAPPMTDRQAARLSAILFNGAERSWRED